MWSRAAGVSDEELVGGVDLNRDLVQVRSGATSYGQIVLGKLRVGTNDGEEGFVHVRCVLRIYGGDRRRKLMESECM